MNTVEAVKSQKKRDAIEENLREQKGEIYADIWKLGINMALRIQDLLAIQYDAKGLDLKKCTYTLKETKTKKKRVITLNNTAIEIINRRRENNPSDEFLFQSHSPKLHRKPPQPISRVSVSRVFKEIGDNLNLKINTHSMRKTRGYYLHTEKHVPIEQLCKIFSHSHPAVTMRYIGITADDIAKTYSEYEL